MLGFFLATKNLIALLPNHRQKRQLGGNLLQFEYSF
jgi:hypothetical protein